MKEKSTISQKMGTTFLSFLCIFWIMPVFVVLWNSFKNKNSINLMPFELPNAETFVGAENYLAAIDKYGLLQSVGWTVFITVGSVAAILLFCSMCGWFITRVKTWWTKLIIVYLGFGAGLAIFMFTGFVRSIPIEIEEAAMIDGCTPLQTFFKIVVPIMKPTYISVGILQTMWIWNDFLLPYLVLDLNKYKTISIVIQYMKGSYGSVDMGAIMAALILALIPVVIFYLSCQKYIIKGVAAGAVKG